MCEIEEIKAEYQRWKEMVDNLRKEADEWAEKLMAIKDEINQRKI